MSASDQILGVAAEIENVLSENDLSIANSVAVKRLQLLATSMAGIDHYAARKASKIASLAVLFYSDRKHRSFPGGADAIYHEMRHALLGTIRSQAQVLRDAAGGT